MLAFSMVGGYMKDLIKKNRTVRVGTYTGMGTCPCQYGKNMEVPYYNFEVHL